MAGQWFSLTSMQFAVAVSWPILGIVNTLTVSITDRRREFGVLRAVGARHGQMRRTVWIEALSIATIGLILGCALGALNLACTRNGPTRHRGHASALCVALGHPAGPRPGNAGRGIPGRALAGRVGCPSGPD